MDLVRQTLKPALRCLATTLLIITSFAWTPAQDKPEFVSTSGHSLNIRKLAFSPDGKYLATLGDDRMLKIWDMSTKMEFRTLYAPGPEIKEIGFSPDSKRLASYGLLEDVMAWDLESGKLVQIGKVPSMMSFVRFRWENGKAIPYSLREEHPFLPVSAMAVEQSQDGKYIASGGTDGMLRIWEAETGKELVAVATGFGYFSGLTFSKEGNRIAVSNIANSVVRIFDSQTGEALKELNEWKTSPENELLMASGFTDVALSMDGRTLAVGYFLSEKLPNQMAPYMQYVVKLIDMETYKGKGFLKGRCHLVTGLGVCSKKNYVLTGGMSFPQGVKVWNLETGEVERVHRGMPAMAVSHAGDRTAIFEYTKEGIELRVYEIPEFKLILRRVYKERAPNKVFLSRDGKRIGLMEPGPYDYKKATAEFFVVVLDIEENREVLRKKVSPRAHGAHFFFTPSGDRIVMAHDSAFVLDSKTGERLAHYRMDYHVGYQWSLGPDGESLIVGGKESEPKQTVYFLDINTGEELDRIQFENDGVVHCLSVSNSGRYLAIGLAYFDMRHLDQPFPIVVWDLKEKREHCRLHGHRNFLRRIAFGQNDKDLFSIDINGMLTSWDLKECKERASFLAYNDLDYLILRPDNYYKASGTGLLGVGFRYKGKLYNFEQFDLIFNRPDLVLESLGANPFRVKMYGLAYEKRLRRSGGNGQSVLESASLPELGIPKKHELPISTEHTSFSFPVTAIDPGGQLDKLHVYVNDVPLYGPEGKDISEAGGKWEAKVEMKLGRGQNVVQVVAQNAAGLKSPVENFEVECRRSFEKPDLYLLSIGASEFLDVKRNLKYAAKDAGDFREALAGSPVFGEVHSEVVVNENATREDILGAGKLFAGSKTDDLAVIFISTHGLLDDKLDYFLATHDTDFSDPASKGLAYEALESLLATIPARNRLILIDACHSGELDREEVALAQPNMAAGITASSKSGPVIVKPKAGLQNSFDYMRALFADLSKGTGATIISAAGGMEFALESGDWANGVFTFALIEGLTMGKADQDRNGKILVSELREYVGRRVREMTKGAQNPTSRRFNLRNDFRVY